MGAYLSKPILDKQSEDSVSETSGLSYGSSAMQGWRINQEDAANALLNFDDGVSLFSVYDGHGGHEVASYSASHFPKFLRKSDSYLKRNFSQALTDTFLQFDEYLVTPEVLATLKQMASGKDEEEDASEEESTQDEVAFLCKEATMPLEEVMAKYSTLKQKFISPKISKTDPKAGGSSDVPPLDLDSSSEIENGKSSSIESPKDDLALNNCSDSEPIKSSQIDTNLSKSESSGLYNGFSSSSQSETIDEPKVNGVSSETKLNKEDIKDEGGGIICPINLDSSGIKEANGDISEAKVEEIESAKIKLEDNGLDNKNIEEIKNVKNINGDSKSVDGKGKGKSSSKGKCSIKKTGSVIESKPKNSRLKRLAAAKFYQQLQDGDEMELKENNTSSDDDEESEDGSFCDLDGENDNLNEAESGEDEDLDDEDEDEEEDLDDDDEDDDDDDDMCGNYQEMQMNMREEPGFDSGCTACIALFHGAELYVGNVGDSRCVVCRDGQAIDMSIDHKPEDIMETNRITKAGGRVTSDGRVNGGLNLSRALGDHSYKQNKNLPPVEQMISPSPDIKTITLTDDDQFVVIACDGIWNSMTSQEVCDFINQEIKYDPNAKLSEICERIFDNCLAPNVDGDGTGCDNMTCIIIRLDDHNRLVKSVSETNKRINSDNETGSTDSSNMLPQEKKQKLDSDSVDVI